MANGGRRPGSGRKPKLLADHIAEGTYRRSSHGPREGVRPADGKRPPMPAGLSPEMETAWGSLLDDLQQSELLDSADSPLYEAFAVAFGRARDARALIAEHGMLVESVRGLVANPMIRVEKDALQQVRMLADQLAIGMRARASLGMAVARGAARKPDAAAGLSAGDIGPSPRMSLVTGGGAA